MEKGSAASSAIEERNVRNKIHIPDDLAISILSKLPVKSLKRFQCVRKSWSLMFENPIFMNMLRNHFSSNNHSHYSHTFLFLTAVDPPLSHGGAFYLLSSDGDKFENIIKFDLPPPLQDDDTSLYILGSVCINGIICIGQKTSKGPVNSFRAVLWNPATSDFLVIPSSPDENVLPYRDPYFEFNGFGYDHIRDDYKLIRYVSFFPVTDEDEDMPLEDKSYEPVLEIYSFRSNSWRILEIDMLDNIRDFSYGQPWTGVYLDGVCHWLGTRGIYGNEGCLVSFDLSNEVLIMTPILDMDETCDLIYIDRHLVVLNESVALISNCFKSTTFHISILGELGVKESWIKLFIVGPIPFTEYPVGVGKKGHICFKQENNELVWLDLNTQVTSKIGVKGVIYGSQIGVYKENPSFNWRIS
ncbi:F-box/kelch-repeat protein At3g06240-like [Vicia villosa]|uniref:F-box/kelch-repeat protein At3g06240-like n=1 Tax=Vicia villosa TaxID=3911 RepID=UPI00273A907F|nr:F-box/kelch-repeat protein At3g06240-like [Vicia villosa]